MRINHVPLAVALLSLGTASFFGQKASSPPAFAYNGAHGPSHWSDLSPDYSVCKTGREQSPVDIRDAVTASLPPIRFDYKPVPLRLVNTGHTLQVNYGAGSTISVGGEQYELKQFHFHRPSEEQINGHPFDMVVHLVHNDSQGKIVVVAILMRAGAASKAIQKVWNGIPTTVGKERDETGVQVNASDLLPANLSYYTYKGSLTTPPCTEGVIWFILKTPMTMSAAQIGAFSSMFPPNARPVQPLGVRIVHQSQP